MNQKICLLYIFLSLLFASFNLRCINAISVESSVTNVGEEVRDEEGNIVELPVLFLSHGAPTLIMRDEVVFGGLRNDVGYGSKANDWYQQLSSQLNLDKGVRRPKAIVMFSAHYEHPNSVMITAQDRYSTLLYDYGGFPQYTYDVKYPCHGSSALARHIQTMLLDGQIPAALDIRRNSTFSFIFNLW